MIYQFAPVMSSKVETSLKRFLHSLRSVVIGLPLEHYRSLRKIQAPCSAVFRRRDYLSEGTIRRLLLKR